MGDRGGDGDRRRPRARRLRPCPAPGGASSMNSSANPPPTWDELLFGRYAAVAWTLCLGTAMHATAWYILATALPSTVADVGGAALVSWVVSIYLVASIVTGSASGLLKSRYGSRPVVVVAATVFLIGTVVAATATSMAMVVAGRALQGFGEGVIWAVTTILVKDLLPNEAVPPMYAILGVVWAAAAVIGPLASGILVEVWSWRGALWSLLPIAVVYIALVQFVVPPVAPSRAELRFPLLRLLLIAAGVVALSVGAAIADPMPSALALAIAVALIAGTLIADGGARTPLFPRDLMRRGAVAPTGIWVLTLMFCAEAGVSVYVALLAQQLFGASPVVAGYILAVVAFAWTSGALAVARARRSVVDILILAGPILLVAGLVGTAVAFAAHALILLIVALVVVGLAFGFAYTFVAQRVLAHARPEESDVTAGALPTLEATGAAFGAALAGLVGNLTGIAALGDPDALRSGAVWVMALGAAIATPAVLGAFVLVRRSAPVPAPVSG
ncbi:MAG: MFS transporter [Alphaproteobacteria bacterium]|nr:MFS transporter [Alphaproteobacteria bacterium]